MKNIIAFQGSPGAYSDLACRAVFPQCETLPCVAFEDVFTAVHGAKADIAMLPIENSIAGRVADIHHLLPEGGLHIIGEHFQPVVHHLLGVKGAKLEDIRTARSHFQALMQCREWLRAQGITPVMRPDTAGAAEEVAALGDKSVAAVASQLAGEIYGLHSLQGSIADRKNNTTRFLILSRSPDQPAYNSDLVLTTLVFRVRSVPAALYKALGGFATNGINITKLESYFVDDNFTAAQFYVDLEGHPDEAAMRLALDELAYFAHEVKILGVYPGAAFRKLHSKAA